MISPDQQRDDGVQVWFLPGPPFGAELFRDVMRRVGPGCAVWPSVDPAEISAGWADRAESLARDLAAAAGPVVLVAHGLGVPVALAASVRKSPAALVLTDGPVSRLDPVTAAVASLARRAPLLLSQLLLRPQVWTRWLASSAGLRRAVINPYVMDRDTVAAIAAPLVAAPAGRRAVTSFLASLADGLPEPTLPACPTLLVWGGADPFYPPSEADLLAHAGGSVRHVSIPGAQWVHPVERPWMLGDALLDLLAGGLAQPGS